MISKRSDLVPRYTPTIMDGAVLRWELSHDGEISASRNGVAISGGIFLRNRGRYDSVVDILHRAYEAHLRICRGGHDAAKQVVAEIESEVSSFTPPAPETEEGGEG